MKFLEKDLEDVVMSLNQEQMKSVGLDFLLNDPNYKKIRQLKIGNYGISDIVYVAKVNLFKRGSFLDIHVVELKKDVISMSAFIQLNRYMVGISEYLTKRGIEHVIQGVLIGNDFGHNQDFCYVTNFSEIKFYTYNYEWNGISFNHRQGFVLIDEGFDKRQKK